MRLGFLAKILPPPENRFYDYFEEGAEVCELSAYLFYQTVHSDPKEREQCLVHTLAYKKRASDALEHCLALLNASFITPIDREDIQLIASNLYKTTKVILKACVNLRIYKIDAYNDIIKEQAELLTTSAEELRKIVSMLRDGAPLKEVTRSSARIKDIESTGDEILYDAMEELFSGKYEALEAMKLRDIYKGIENALDICSVISDLIVNISLKHS
ncbi:MAG: DUF47 domain-containing protein [Desulfobulbus sp.]|jgi:uncharacterized protein Yka (UPF0111/DUF47 family)